MAGLRRLLKSDPQRNELREHADRAHWQLVIDTLARRERRPFVRFEDKRSGATVATFKDVASALKWFRGTASPRSQWWNE